MITIIGIDPGPRPGIVQIAVQNKEIFAHYKHVGFTDETPGNEWAKVLSLADEVALEEFIITPGTVRKTRKGSHQTLDQIGLIKDACRALNIKLVTRSAGQVKPWATDRRLEDWGLSAYTGHHRDAARHALFHAVYSDRLPMRPRK